MTLTTSQRYLKRSNRELGAAKQTVSPRKHARHAASPPVSKANMHTPKVRATTEALASSTNLLKQLVVISSNMAQLDEVYEAFSQRCRGEKSEHICYEPLTGIGIKVVLLGKGKYLSEV